MRAVFRQRKYDRSIHDTLFWRGIDLILRGLNSFFGAIREVPVLRWILVGVGLLVVVLIVARAVYLARAQRPGRIIHTSGHKSDPWKLAQEAAGSGRFVDGAHFLYLALIETLAHRAKVKLHPAKTVGDYTRDLRRFSPPDLPAFREFATMYEPIVWGSGRCERAEYERMQSLAESLRNAA